METNIRQDNNEEVEIDIMQIIRMLLSKIWIVIVAGVATAIVAFGITEIAITPQYQSSIKLYIINRQNGTTTTLSDIQSSTQLVKDLSLIHIYINTIKAAAVIIIVYTATSVTA